MYSILRVLTLVSLAVVGCQATSRTSAPSGCLTVAASGATYTSVNAALTALGTGSASDSACIFVNPGTYNEQVVISFKGSLKIYGYTTSILDVAQNTVSIVHSENSTVAGGDEPSSTLDVRVADFSLYNINVTNSFGKGTQAVAVTANANQVGFYASAFFGYQDTLYAKGMGYQYYKNCYIQGAVDYIFGDASAWFEKCTLASVGSGSITAMNRATDSETTWYVFDYCTVEAAAGYDLTGDVYLGRPWGVASRVIYQNSYLSDIINAAGWTTMTDGAEPIYKEYNNTGPGSSTASREYETTATAAVTMAQLFSSGYSWIDTSY